MNKRIPQSLSAAVLVFLLFFAVLAVVSEGFSNFGSSFLGESAPVTLVCVVVLGLIGAGVIGQLQAKRWAHMLTVSVLTPIALASLVISFFLVRGFDFFLYGDVSTAPSIGYRIGLYAIILFPLLVIAAVVTLILSMRQQK